MKQAPRQWYKKFDSFMVGHEYTRTNADHCVYVRIKFVILLLYVDDMLIVGQDAGVIGNLKKDLFKSFDMRDLSPARQILDMHWIKFLFLIILGVSGCGRCFIYKAIYLVSVFQT